MNRCKNRYHGVHWHFRHHRVWLADRPCTCPWLLLVIYYGLRGLSLLTIHTLLVPTVEPVLWIFVLFYDLDWVATAPPTVVLCRE